MATHGGTVGATEPAWSLTDDVPDNEVTWHPYQSTAITAAAPSDQQGFGRLTLDEVISDYPARDLVSSGGPITNQSSVTRNYSVQDPNLPVKVVLSWTDPPGPIDEDTGTTNPLVNNLNLTVNVGAPCSTKYIGNHVGINGRGQEESLAFGCSDSPNYDYVNNVEIVKFYPPGVVPFSVMVSGVDGVASQDFAVVVYNGYDPLTGTPPAAPTNISATATSTSSVAINWPTSAGATAYELRRKTNGDTFSTIATQTATSFPDSGLTSNTSYIYQVRAKNGVPPNQFVSAWTTPDVATTLVFSDEPLQPTQTVVARTQIDELRTAANALRAAAGLAPYTFTDPTITAGTTTVQATHINELRRAIQDALSTLSIPLPSYAHSTLVPGTTVVSATDVQELRNVLK